METTPLVTNISFHAWNADHTQLAICPNNNEVWIYSNDKNTTSTDVSTWKRIHVLSEHSGEISGIDWNPTTNLIVTCSHDRNAYVWRYESDPLTKQMVWKPTLVILRINRAAMYVKWSPLGNKFAVGSSAKCVPVCYFEEENNWWISKMIKKHKSTVVQLAWCPNNKFLVTASTDNRCRIFSGYLEGIDSAEDDGFGSIWPDQHDFGTCLAEFDAGAWVNSVAWSPSAFRLVYATHASNIGFIQLLAGSEPLVTVIQSSSLPYTDVQFTDDNTLIAAGHNMNIDIYKVQGGNESQPIWKYMDKVDKKQEGAGASTGKSASFSGARAMFSAAADRGAAFGSDTKSASETQTKHKNFIVNIQLLNDIKKFTTAGMDGRVLFWDLPK
jgi:actin related protein 2/3 complex subunit 1A/1B